MSDKKYSQVSEIYRKIKTEMGKVIIGQDEIIDHLVIALFAGGHVLLEGVPGLGKSLMASALSRIIGSDYKRIQFTPDLMPSDIIGTSVYNMQTGSFKVRKGPLFTNILLADEINRSPAKTQSALLQGMQEKEVSIDGTDYKLDDFFICLATQNPIEMEGTYPLPEAQVDRFLMKLLIDYPSQEQENNILFRYREGFDALNLDGAGIMKIINKEGIGKIKKAINTVIIDDKIINYITGIVQKTRNSPGVEMGSSPRGSVSLLKSSRALAVLEGRDFVTPDDVKELVLPVLRHRIILEPESEIEGITADDILKRILEEAEVPR